MSSAAAASERRQRRQRWSSCSSVVGKDAHGLGLLQSAAATETLLLIVSISVVLFSATMWAYIRRLGDTNPIMLGSWVRYWFDR